MIELGKIQDLEVIRISSIGVFLNSKQDKSEQDVLLPRKQVPEGIKIGDEISVFIYRDSEDRLISTTNKPKIALGEIASLKVVEKTNFGAFLDWGLEKDLFLPFKEQTCKIEEDEECLVTLYIDKSDRLCATMNVYLVLTSESPYKKDDIVSGTIYSINNNMGAFVAVENKYQGLIKNDELYGNIKCGMKIEARVTKVRQDGKLDLSLREKISIQMDKDAEIILKRLNCKEGKLLLNDKSKPEEIKQELSMSKKEFKRAIGRLLKQGKIKFIEGGIELIKK